MKKREIIELNIQKRHFGGKSEGIYEGKRILLNGGLPGQKVQALIKIIRKDRVEAKILEVLQASPKETQIPCSHYGICGGCSMLSLPYEDQLEQKKEELEELFLKSDHREIQDPVIDFQIYGSSHSQEYKNKMEFTFGDEEKNGSLTLGMHVKGKSNSVTTVSTCQIIDEDYRKILVATRDFFAQTELKPYRILSHKGHLRHFVLRKGKNTNEILLNLVTTSQPWDLSTLDNFWNEKTGKFLEVQEKAAFYEENDIIGQWVDTIQKLDLEGSVVGILHTINNSLSDAVIEEEKRILFGRDRFTDSVLGREFEISPFSFFQTNTWGAETLYSLVRKMACSKEEKRKTIFDLYSGTGTIGIILADLAHEIVSVELVEEAVEMAKNNAKKNQCTNITAIAGDVGEEVRKRGEKPELIVLDPPRSGIHPKAIGEILFFNAKEILYISCNPKALMIDLKRFKENGYEIKDIKAVDMFPNTNHVECIVLLTKTQKQGLKGYM